MKPLTKAQAEAALRNEGREGWAKKREALQRLPPDVDAELAASAVLGQLGEGYNAAWSFGRSCQRIPPQVIREALRRLPSEATTPERIFLREAVRAELPDAALTKAWLVALQSLLDLSLTYGWGSKQRKAKLKALAAKPVVVAAVQAAVVGSKEPGLDMLAVLAIEASDASVDALLPTFSKGDADSRLEMLKVHATMNPSMTAMLETVTKRRVQKEEKSSAVSFVSQLLGLDEPLKAVKCMVWLSSTQLNRSGVPLYQGALSLDSKWNAWWSVHLSRVTDATDMKRVSFGASEEVHDELAVGRSTIEDLPKWLASTAKKLKISWNTDGLVSGSLRGKKRDQFTAWLFSALRK